MDEDCDTDEEMIIKLNDIVFNDLEEAIAQLMNSKEPPESLISNYNGIN